jgi:putative endonuclease
MNNKKTSNQLKGALGENIANNYLLQNDFVILERNWRYKHCEVDIICKKNNTLHFVEVKTRLSSQFGNPEESINEKKMNALKKAAEEYINQNPEWKLLQFDVVSIKLKGEIAEEIFFIEDIFF